MRQVELGAHADLIILRGRVGQRFSSPPQHFRTVGHAIRHVMEVLPTDQRQDAVIQTTARLLFFPEIEAVFETRMNRDELRSVCA